MTWSGNVCSRKLYHFGQLRQLFALSIPKGCHKSSPAAHGLRHHHHSIEVDQAEQDQNLFFLDGPGGTGKSFLLEKILANTRRHGKIAIATASSGIAALLLTGGKTVHSTFKLPLLLNECTHCNIPVQSSLANLMRQASIIVWDEASMSSRYTLEAVVPI
uniref:ATP-dependent DNA helicase n=1 Tax=Anopheles epiroticus TaxID=199890 RepID=A0A182PUC4_9DIPT